MKILNLYAGIGGNRKLYPEGHEITAVEYNPEIAEVYKKFFPNDNVIIGDAHEYLLNNFKQFDFIWASPPCQSHSVCNHFLKGQGIHRYPDMKLWQEIIFLKHFFKGYYCVENVKSYYEPFIKPQTIGRHYVWSNFTIADKEINYVQIGTMNRNASKDAQRKAIIREAQIPELTDLHGLNLTGIKIKNKRQVLRNCVYPEMGLHIFNEMMKAKSTSDNSEYIESKKQGG
jgi:DNA (cytosine-5)-methyltransferase 1